MRVRPAGAPLPYTIAAEFVVTLGSLEDPTSATPFSWVARDSEGLYYVGPTFSQGEIAVYGVDGKFLRTLGRMGQGPGEFDVIRWIEMTGGDTLHVFTPDRHTMMSPRGDVYGTTSGLYMASTYHVLADGRVLLKQYYPSRELAGFPAHIINREGRRVLSFGYDSAEPEGSAYIGGHKDVSVGLGDRVWMNPYGQYRIELWDTTGVHRKTLVQEPPWLTPWTKTEPREPFSQRPRARVVSVHEDGEGRLWVTGREADFQWESGVEYPEYEEVYDVRLEVVDHDTGTLLASRRFVEPNQLFYGFLQDGLVFAREVDENGLGLVHIWRISLQPVG